MIEYFRRATRSHDADLHGFAGRVAAPLQAPERADPTLVSRVMNDVWHGGARNLAPRRSRSMAVPVTRLGGLVIAVGIAALMAGTYLLAKRDGAVPTQPVAVRTDTVHVVRFVFVAPEVSSVAIVGDFNRWDVNSHRLTRAATPGVWTVSVPMAAGRHEYAFVIDGTRWVADPAAGRSIVDEFGGVSSVIRVGGNES